MFSFTSFTLPLYRSRLGRLLPRGALTSGIQNHILVLEAVQLIGETFAGRLKLDFLQEDLLGRRCQQLVEIPVLTRVLSTRFQRLLEFIHYRHRWIITEENMSR